MGRHYCHALSAAWRVLLLALGFVTFTVRLFAQEQPAAKDLNPLFVPGQPPSPTLAKGMINGKYYFTRLVLGKPWNSYRDGTKAFLKFLNNYYPCEDDCRTMTMAELKDALAIPERIPPLLYLYCDDSFAVSVEEADLLHAYLEKGGFILLDSRPDKDIKERVTRAFMLIHPYDQLDTVTKKHPITSFLFTLNAPGIGENVITGVNYGIQRENRLAVFYTMGNFAHLFENNKPDAFEYSTAQYQMMANIFLYAITKGDRAKLPKPLEQGKP